MGPQYQANHIQERTKERLEGIEDGLTELAMALKAVAQDRMVPGTIRAPTETETMAGMTLASDPQFQTMVEAQRALSAQMQTVMQSLSNNLSVAPPPAQYQTDRSNPQGGLESGGRGCGRGGRFRAMDNICWQYCK